MISVAVVHHFATRERRIQAMRALLDALTLGNASVREHEGAGRVMISVWALEQRNSRRGWDRGMEQDVLVPWVLKGGGKGSDGTEQTFHRFYHLYQEGELEEDVQAAGGVVLDGGYEADNWWVIATR